MYTEKLDFKFFHLKRNDIACDDCLGFTKFVVLLDGSHRYLCDSCLKKLAQKVYANA